MRIRTAIRMLSCLLAATGCEAVGGMTIGSDSGEMDENSQAEIVDSQKTDGGGDAGDAPVGAELARPGDQFDVNVPECEPGSGCFLEPGHRLQVRGCRWRPMRRQQPVHRR